MICSMLVLCLNRTFYGIERLHPCWSNRSAQRLNRTFYGIESLHREEAAAHVLSLNRTFYGIERRSRSIILSRS